MWAEKDSNLRTRERTDLQSVAFSHSAIYPFLILDFSIADCRLNIKTINHPNQNPKSHLSESNQRPTDYKSVALPTELNRQTY